MKKLMIVFAAVFLITACTKDEIINQLAIPAQKKETMGLQLNTYGGFTAAQLKARASIPSQGDITVGSNYIICSSVDIPSEIRDVIGEGSNDLGTIYLSAKVNIWSNFGPREWYVSWPGILNRPISNPYDMANLCGYNHNAVPPVSFNAPFSFTKQGAGSSVTTSIAAKIKMGEYDWGRLGATHCKVVTYDGESVYSQSGILPINGAGNFLTFDNVSFTILTGTVYTKEYITKIILCTSDGSEIAALPITGIVSVEVIAAIVNKVAVTINGNSKTFSMGPDSQYFSNSIYQTGLYTGLGGSANGKSLNSIVYNIYNSTTNALVSTLTVTSFNSYEYPLLLDNYMVNDSETFYAAFGGDGGRPTPAAGQYLRVIMNYI